MKKLDLDDLTTAALSLPTFVPRRYKPGDTGTWSGHLAFASDLIQAIQPKILVELGTHWGESYFTFCQTIAENRLDCLCYAIDHWLGERHSGAYGEEVYGDVREYNQQYYKTFSYLVRSNFDEAIAQFSDESIDLLHIDGLHTLEASSHDFWSWWPKVRPGGFVLLHDICARHADFGIWKLWEEIKNQFSETFEFRHSWGLGVVCKPGGTKAPAFVEALFQGNHTVREQIRRQYAIYASHLENLLAYSSLTAKQANDSEVYGAPCPVGVKAGPMEEEARSSIQRVEPGTTTTVSFSFSGGVKDGFLRLRPADRPCVVEISQLSLYSTSGQLVAQFSGTAVPACFTLSGTAVRFQDDYRYLLLSYGSDPRVTVLPVADNSDMLGRLEVTLRVDLLDVLSPAITSIILNSATVARNTGAEQALLQAELRSAISERDSLRGGLQALESSLSQTGAEINSLKDQLQSERSVRESIMQSKSWRVTEPMRRIMARLRGTH